MADHLLPPLAAGSALLFWLVAGTFFTFSDFIMRSLNAQPAGKAIAAMQAINVAVFRTAFLAGFFALALLALGFVAIWMLAPGLVTGLLAAAGLVYLATVVFVTVAANVPLNERLASADPDAPEAPATWSAYTRRWTAWNHLRTAGGIAAASLASAATVLAFL